MYGILNSRIQRARIVAACVASLLWGSVIPASLYGQQPESVVRNISRANERLEMTVNTSQIITLGSRIPKMLVNNPELVTARPLSENQVQIAALKPGVTQINLWDEKGQIYTVDLLIFGDVRELEVNLKRMFPSSSIRVIRLTNSLVLEGQVDRPEAVSTIFRLAEDYAPKIVDNLTVGGAQQVILKVKIMEVSRTKLRNIGFDFAQISGGSFVSLGSSGLLSNAGQIGTQAGNSTVQFGIVDGSDSFFGFLQALEQDGVIKTLADPTLVTVSGRPANFNSGGEIFFQINNGISGSTVQSQTFGTQVDFLPIVLGNGRIRLEVRPQISDIDNSTPLGNELFRTKVSRVDTGVEMNAGQTLALAGLIQTKIDSQVRGLPYLKDVPYVGAAFRSTRVNEEEVELLIMVTPEFGAAMDAGEVPPCGPGMETMTPNRHDLYWKGLIEVPACGPCGASEPCACNAPGLGCNNGACGQYGPQFGGQHQLTPYSGAVVATDGYNSFPAADGTGPMPVPAESFEQESMPITPSNAMPAAPPSGPAVQPALPVQPANPRGMPDPSAQAPRPQWFGQGGQPVNPANHYNPAVRGPATPRMTSTPGLIGPIGYDMQK